MSLSKVESSSIEDFNYQLSDFFNSNQLCCLCGSKNSSSDTKGTHVSNHHITERYLGRLCNYCFRPYGSTSIKNHKIFHINGSEKCLNEAKSLVNYFGKY